MKTACRQSLQRGSPLIFGVIFGTLTKIPCKAHLSVALQGNLDHHSADKGLVYDVEMLIMCVSALLA